MISLDLSPTIHLEYLAEGAANVVYRISVHSPSPSLEADLDFGNHKDNGNTPPPTELPALPMDAEMEGKLVRMRKDLPSTTPVLDSQRQFENIIVPLFRARNMSHHLVEQVLFQPSQDLIFDCNTKLRTAESLGIRDPKRHSVYLAEYESYGALITDMTSGTNNDVDYVSVEFKPKWLAQSPSAPSKSRRCRTCALRTMRYGSKNSTEQSGHGSFCPLNLVSNDEDAVAKAVSGILGKNFDANGTAKSIRERTSLRTRLFHLLFEHPLLQLLKDLQMQMDPNGVFEADLHGQDFLTAMTLRDCTLFLKVGHI